MIEKWRLNSFLSGLDISSFQIGSDLWWKRLRVIGCPLIKMKNNQTYSALFIWKDPQGDEAQSSTKTVLLDVNSLTDHHSWEPACLSRINGTDIWLGQLTVDAKWRGSYSFIPLKAHQLPNVVRRKGDGSRESQRAWWIDVAKNQIHDELNPLPVQESGWGMSSPLHLPDAPVELGWKEWDKGNLNTVPSDQIHSIEWLSPVLGNQRNGTFFSTAMSDAPLVVLLDGQKWGAVSGTLSVIQYLTDQKKIAPAHYLLIPSIDGQTRWKELSCHDAFWQALIDELLFDVTLELEKTNRSISDYVVAGQSLGGLSALYAGLYFPDYFSKVISLSGSFWWPESNRMHAPKTLELADNILPSDSLAEQILNDRVSVSNLHIFQTVGLGEKNMCLYNDMTFQAIQGKGGEVHYEKVHGGHDWLSWRSSLMNGLMHLIPGE